MSINISGFGAGNNYSYKSINIKSKRIRQQRTSTWMMLLQRKP